MSPIVVARNLTKKFKQLVAVDVISFTINEGECFGFLGPNGAGKTTTIKMIHRRCLFEINRTEFNRMNLSYRIYYVWKRNLFSYKRFVVPTLLVSMGEPLFYLLAMGVGLGAYMGLFGGKTYLQFLASGLVVTSIMFSSTFECLYGSFIRMIHEKIYDSLIVTPISVEDAVAGDIAWGIFRGLISGTIMLVIAALLKAVILSPQTYYPYFCLDASHRAFVCLPCHNYNFLCP